MTPGPAARAISTTRLNERVAQEFFLVARESAVGALLSVLVMILTHVNAQPLSRLALWVVAVLTPLVVRALSAQVYLSFDRAQQARWRPWLYSLQWVGYLGTGVLWVMSLSMLGSGKEDTLFFVRLVFIIAVLTFYLSVIGIDRVLYAAFAVTIAVGAWLELTLHFPGFMQDMPNTHLALALYVGLLLIRSRSEEGRLKTAIEAQLTQEVLLEELRIQTTRDALTGTNNRGHIENELRRLIQQAESGAGTLSVLLIDVDFFKRVNDSFGHDSGDDVLRTLTRRTLDVLRDTDVLGRWGGEEFLAVLPGTTLASAMDLAMQLRAAIAELEFQDASGTPFRMTVSIGMAQHQHGDKADAVLKQADLALYDAKKAGRDCCRAFPASPPTV